MTNPKSALYLIVWEICKEHKLHQETEYKFSKDRKFRFDMAIPELKIGLEYEGVISKKSRHTTITGYSKDTEKYNLAAIEGWRVLRYTANTVTNAHEEITKLVKNLKAA